jgi:dihydrodiol dehydrogenase / D-xylose 1-dehydrogenase (NADP)
VQNKFRWGILGPGRIAHRFADGLNSIGDACLYAVGSASAERAQSFSAQHHPQKVYASHAELVNDPNVDAVYIANSHPFHLATALLCLEHGKPVLCEKPLTVNAHDSRKLIETAEKKSLFLMEGLWSRFLPIYQQVHEWLEQKVIGDVLLLNSTMGFRKPVDLQDRLYNPNLAGGVLLDQGVYPIALSQWFIGENPGSFAVKNHFSSNHVDDLTAVTLQYPGGAISQFTCNFVAETVNDFFIYGSKGHIRIHANYWQSTQATLVLGEKLTILTKPFRATGFEYEAEEVMTCVRAGKLESSTMPHAHTQANMELMDSIRSEIGLVYPFEKD